MQVICGVKKNNSKGVYWYKDNIRRYKTGFLIFNIITISIVFLIFTGILSVIVEQRFFYDVHTSIQDINTKIDKASINPVIQDIESDDARITIVYYYSDPKISSIEQIMNPTVYAKHVFGALDKEDVTAIEDINSSRINEFNQIEIDGHMYMTYVSKKWFKAKDLELQADVIVSYVKIYMNIDGEIAAKKL